MLLTYIYGILTKKIKVLYSFCPFPSLQFCTHILLHIQQSRAERDGGVDDAQLYLVCIWTWEFWYKDIKKDIIFSQLYLVCIWTW